MPSSEDADDGASGSSAPQAAPLAAAAASGVVGAAVNTGIAAHHSPLNPLDAPGSHKGMLTREQGVPSTTWSSKTSTLKNHRPEPSRPATCGLLKSLQCQGGAAGPLLASTTTFST